MVSHLARSSISGMLRDLARHAVRDEVLRQAWLLFARQGFEATTIDQVAEASGMSRRTFFRYFASKDDLVIERLIEAGERIAATVAARPADEGAWSALRGAFEELVEAQEAKPVESRALWTMLRDEPAVTGPMEERRRRWIELLSPPVARRLPAGRGREMRAAAVTGAALACLDAAQQAWADQPSSRLGTLLDQAMGALS